MGVTQVAAMPQDILPVITTLGRAGEMGASEAAGFKKMLQERQSSSAAAPDQADRHAASSSPRPVIARSGAHGPGKGRQSVSRRQPWNREEGDAAGDGNDVPKSKAEGALSKESSPQLKEGDQVPDEAAVEKVQEVSESAISVAGNAVPVVADATPKATVAKVVSEEMSDHEQAAATVAVGSVGADIEAGTLLDSGAGAAGTAAVVNDGAATVAAGGANAAEKAGETAVTSAIAVTEKPAQHTVPHQESKGAATEERSNTGTAASEKTQPDLGPLQKLTVEGASGTDPASARLEAAAGLAAVESNLTDAAAKQNQDAGAEPDLDIQPGQMEAGQQVQRQEGGVEAHPATTTTQEPSPAADVQKEPAGVPVNESAVKGQQKEARLEAVHRLHGPAEAVEQGTAGPGRSVETTEVGKTSSLVDAQGTVPQAKAGEEGSGNSAGKGGNEQQQAKQGEQVLPPPVGADLRTPEAAAGSYKNEAERTSLHRSLLSQVKDGAVTHDSKGNGQMNIRLNPAELGELNIQVRMEDGRVRVDVQADNRMVKDLLMSNLDTLKEALASKNFTMEGFEVSTGGGFNNAHPEQRANPQQRSARRITGSGYAEADGSEGRVNYLTADVNNLLDVRF